MSQRHDAVIALLNRRLGLSSAASVAGAHRGELVAAIDEAMRCAGIDTPHDFAAAVEGERVSIDALVERLTVRETYFFRHPGQFDILRGRIVPELKELLGRRAQLRVWCAGCATGEEPYSVAILLFEAGLLHRSHILGTDVSRVSVARARAARYGRWSFRESRPGFLARWFQPVGGGVHMLDESIRQHVTFDHLNLATDPFPTPVSGIWGLDLILCRNVMLYFDAETIQRVAVRLYDSLREGGWLLTGPSDPSLEDLAPFQVTHTDVGTLYRRRPRAMMSAPSVSSRLSRAAVPRSPLVAAAPRARRATTPPGRRRRTNAPAPVDGRMARAKAAFDRGDWAVAAELAAELTGCPQASALSVRALANLGQPLAAEVAAARSLAAHGLSVELHFLRALLLLTLKRDEDALESARRALYLDRSFVVGYLLLGEIQARLGKVRNARIAYRTARRLCEGLPAETVVPLADGHSASRLADVAAAQLARLELDDEGVA